MKLQGRAGREEPEEQSLGGIKGRLTLHLCADGGPDKYEAQLDPWMSEGSCSLVPISQTMRQNLLPESPSTLFS